MFDNFRRQAACFADFSIRGIVFELEREQLQRERTKTFTLKTGLDELVQARGEV